MGDVPTLPRKTFRHTIVLILGYLHKVSEPEICVCQVAVTGPSINIRFATVNSWATPYASACGIALAREEIY
jgi:hypothetical protein